MSKLRKTTFIIVRVEEAFKATVIRIAEFVDESLSDFARNAIHNRCEEEKKGNEKSPTKK